MSAKIFLSPSVKFIPQMDVSLRQSDNQGWEGSQTFLARSADVGVGGNLNLFTRGTRWEAVYPEISPIFRNMTMKTFDPEDHAPGIVAIRATFTGPQYNGNGSSGEEATTATTELNGQLEDYPISRHPKWLALDAGGRNRLGWLILGGEVKFDIASARYGNLSPVGEFLPFPDSVYYPAATGNELIFATMITEGDTTYKRTGWKYSYRTESKTGFTAAQLNSAGKIVDDPPGNPVKPTGDWTWLLTGPNQTQSGPDRFFKELQYDLIFKDANSEVLYTGA